MVTYSLCVKGTETYAYATLALKMRGIMHFLHSYATASRGTYANEMNFRISVPDYERVRTTTRLQEWFASDINFSAPFPNGSLLIWSYTYDDEPVTV